MKETPSAVGNLTEGERSILRFLRNGGDPVIATPLVIAVNIDYSRGYVRNRLPNLRRVGLVEYHDNGGEALYKLTSTGHDLIQGSLAHAEAERLESALADD